MIKKNYRKKKGKRFGNFFIEIFYFILIVRIIVFVVKLILNDLIYDKNNFMYRNYKFFF